MIVSAPAKHNMFLQGCKIHTCFFPKLLSSRTGVWDSHLGRCPSTAYTASNGTVSPKPQTSNPKPQTPNLPIDSTSRLQRGRVPLYKLLGSLSLPDNFARLLESRPAKRVSCQKSLNSKTSAKLCLYRGNPSNLKPYTPRP